MMKILLMTITLLMAAAPLFSSGLPYDARGPRTAAENPALLGFRSTQCTALELPGAGGIASNNSFSVRFWNRHIAGDEYWDEDDVRAILDRIPDSGLEVDAELSAPVMGFRYNFIAVNAELVGLGSASVPKEVAEMALVGTKLNEEYVLGDLIGESVALTDISAAAGHSLLRNDKYELTAGLALHYYQGLAAAHVYEFEGDLLVTENTISGAGVFRSAYGLSGNGFGFDLGLAGEFTSGWTVGLAAKRLGSRIHWNLEETTTETFETDMNGINIDSLDEDGYGDRTYTNETVTTEGGSLSLRLPTEIQTTALYSGFRLWEFASRIGWYSDSPYTQESLEAGFDIRYLPANWTYLRGGALTGGPHGSLFSFGTGLRLGTYELDLLGIVTGGLGNSAHGAGIGISQRLFF